MKLANKTLKIMTRIINWHDTLSSYEESDAQD
jgi:hypothetical protein